MSYTKCAYHNCDNISLDISMFRFPVHDQGRLILWIRNSGNIYLDSLSNEELRRRYICAAHILPAYVHKGSVRSRLIGPAIPVHFQYIEGGDGTSNQPHETTDATVEDDVMSSPEILKVKTPTKFYVKRTHVSAPAVDDNVSMASSRSSSFKGLHLVTTPTQRLSRKCLFDGPQKRLSRKCLFEAKLTDTPITKRLKMTASSILKKNEAQRALIRRLRAKSKPQLKVKENYYRSEVSKTLALMQLRKKGDKKKWTEEEKNLCLSLFYKSPTTYNFLRRQGVVLAAPSTIRLWLSKANCLPGLCPDVFKKIEKRFENSSLKEKACVVLFDEMSIMSNLDYSKKYDFIEGFEDLGGNHRCGKLAKSALVFLVRGLYGKWKLPVAYFLSGTNVKGESLKLIMKAVLNKLFDFGLLPKAVVCDQATTNQNMFKSLGVSCKYPFFFCNGRKIFAIFDVPHLIKNIRNNFLKNDYINGGEQMSFQDVVKTYEIDKSSNLSRSLTKLTDRHINPNTFQKMTVSLATQIFSNSVAAAIKTAKRTGQLKSSTAEATANFIKVINNMFDALNSQQQYDKNPYKHALSKNSTLALNAIKEGKNIFQHIQKICFQTNKSGQRKIKLTRPPCFDGVVQSCEAVLQLLHEECSDSSIKYLITKKLNQDVIENLFARYRQKGGSNKNPTAKLLRTIFRSSLVNSLIKLPTTKNCEDEDDIYIQLAIGEPASPTQNVPTSSMRSASIDNAILSSAIAGFPARAEEQATVDNSMAISSTREDMRKIAVASTSSEKNTLEECSVAYFAGYLAKSCLTKNPCHICSKNLIKDLDLDDERQLLIINKSYDCCKDIKLKMPSDKLLQLVRMALNCYDMHFNNIVHYNKIKSRLFDAILNFFRCEAPELLSLSCEEHLLFIIDHMILVKVHFYCKNKKSNILEGKAHPKLRILSNK